MLLKHIKKLTDAKKLTKIARGHIRGFGTFMDNGQFTIVLCVYFFYMLMC